HAQVEGLIDAEFSQYRPVRVWRGLANWELCLWCSGGPPVSQGSHNRERVDAMMKSIARISGRNGSMKMHEKKRMKITFFGHFDSTNFGNESTLQAILHHLRYYQPDAAVTCISTGPEATVATHQIEALPISGNLLFKSWLPRNPLLKLVRRIFI